MRMHRIAAIVLLLGAGMLAGCSRAAMKTTPLWDSEYEGAVGPPEDRINVWPLFYYRNPAYSVLWPLISATPDGHAFVPFYEYTKSGDELRVGTIHQILPAVAQFNGEEERRRVLNVVWDGKDNELTAFPIYAQDFDDGWLSILPVLIKGKGWFWTPLYMQTKHTKGALGPLFLFRKEGDSRAAFYPLPFLGHWRSNNGFGFMTLPFVFYTRYADNSTVNIGGLLYHRNKDGEDVSSHFLWPLGAAGREEGERWNQLIPLWYSRADEKGQRFISLPFTRVKTENLELTNALLNGYVGVKGGKNEYESFIFPFFHRFKNAGSAGHAAFPLYALFRNDDGTKTLYSPLVNFRDDGSFINIGGPAFYHSDRDGTRKQAVLWPFSFWWKSKDESGSWVLPLYYRRKAKSGDGMFATLGGGFAQSGDEKRASVLGPVYYQKSSPGENYRTVAWPFFHQWESENEKGSMLLPIYLWNRGEGSRQFYSPLYSGGNRGEEKFFNLGFFLFGSSWSEMRRQYRFVGPIGGIETNYSVEKPRHAVSRKHWIFPLYSATNTTERRMFRSIMSRTDVSKLGVEGEKKSLLQNVTSAIDARPKDSPKPDENFSGYLPRTALIYDRRYLLGLAEFERSLTISPAAESNRDSVTENSAALSLENFESLPVQFQHRLEGRVFPLFSYRSDSGEGGKFNLLWRLYDSDSQVQDGGEKYSRQRVLWRVFHRERLGDRVSTDIFPFIAYDRAENLFAWSFAGGLVGYENDEGASRLKLLYIPIQWGK